MLKLCTQTFVSCQYFTGIFRLFEDLNGAKSDTLTALQALLKYPILPTCRIRTDQLPRPPRCFRIFRPCVLDRPM